MNSRLSTAGGAVVDEMIVVSCSSANDGLAGASDTISAGTSTAGATTGDSARADPPRGEVKLPAAWLDDGIELTGGFPIAGGAGVVGTAAICGGAGAGCDGGGAG